MDLAEILGRLAAELALIRRRRLPAVRGQRPVVDLIYFVRRYWRAATIYSRHPRAYASYYVFNKDPGFIAILVPAWDEAAVIASMLKATLKRLDYDNYRIFVGHYRNDPATAAAIASVVDPRIQAVQVEAEGPDDQGRLPQPPLRRADRVRAGARAWPPRRSCCTTPRTSSTAMNCGFSTD